MTDKSSPASPSSPADQPGDARPAAKTRPAPSNQATQVWERKAGPFGSNPIPR